MGRMDIHLSRRWDNELYHYGIIGQRKGVRRFQNLDRTWTEAGKIRYGRKGEVRDEGWVSKTVSGYSTAHSYEKERKKGEIDSSTGFHLKKDNMTPEEDLKRVNPKYDTDALTGRFYRMNCMYCTAAYEMRRRGYDVTAHSNPRGAEAQAMINWFPGGKMQRIIRGNDSSDEDWSKEVVKKMVDRFPDGSRGNCGVKWGKTNSGHSVMFEINNGKVTLWDGQSGTKYTDPSEIFKLSGRVHLYRFDNLDFDKDLIKECCK